MDDFSAEFGDFSFFSGDQEMGSPSKQIKFGNFVVDSPNQSFVSTFDFLNCLSLDNPSQHRLVAY